MRTAGRGPKRPVPGMLRSILPLSLALGIVGLFMFNIGVIGIVFGLLFGVVLFACPAKAWGAFTGSKRG